MPQVMESKRMTGIEVGKDTVQGWGDTHKRNNEKGVLKRQGERLETGGMTRRG